MDEIEQRLRISSEACIKSYEVWRTDQKNVSAREGLQEAVHELRKVASRLEIEMAVSERDQMSDRPISIPPHRSSQRPRREGQGDDQAMDNDQGGNAPAMSQGQPQGNGNGGPAPRQNFQRTHNNRPRRPMGTAGNNRPPQGE